MGEIKKSIPAIIINALFTLLIMFFVFRMNRSAASDDNITERIDQLQQEKLDKTDFDTYKTDHVSFHKAEQKYVDQIKDHVDQRVDDLKVLIQSIKE